MLLTVRRFAGRVSGAGVARGSRSSSSSSVGGSDSGSGKYDDQPAPAWPRDDSPLPPLQLRPAPRPNEPHEDMLRRLLYQSRCGTPFPHSPAHPLSLSHGRVWRVSGPFARARGPYRALATWEAVSSKRGILENDILLGTFAARHLPSLRPDELRLYDDLLCENDWDIYYWVGPCTPCTCTACA
jgi:succinate dehydrogenase flavin-adding protein (antitoxin of CptAB toxin-antitoxin module)